MGEMQRAACALGASRAPLGGRCPPLVDWRQRLHQPFEAVERHLEEADVGVAQLENEERRAPDRQGAKRGHDRRQEVDRRHQPMG